MDTSFNITTLIPYVKSKKKIIFLLSFVITIITVSYLFFSKLNLYQAQIKFYITNSESIDYNTILNKSFIDISVENRDLLRLQSFGYSSALLSNLVDSIKANETLNAPSLLNKVQQKEASNYLASLYEVMITDLGEIEVTVNCEQKEVASFLCHQIMEGINNLNNEFLSKFKTEQIEAREGQIFLLEKEKTELFDKINKTTVIINATDSQLNAMAKRFTNQSNRSYLENLRELVFQQNSPERLELGMNLEKVSNLDENIESFKRALYNDRLSLEMLKKKRPYITQDKPSKSKAGLSRIVAISIVIFFVSTFSMILILALGYRYQKYLRLILS